MDEEVICRRLCSLRSQVEDVVRWRGKRRSGDCAKLGKEATVISGRMFVSLFTFMSFGSMTDCHFSAVRRHARPAVRRVDRMNAPLHDFTFLTSESEDITFTRGRNSEA
jgi:hypothetical protein